MKIFCHFVVTSRRTYIEAKAHVFACPLEESTSGPDRLPVGDGAGVGFVAPAAFVVYFTVSRPGLPPFRTEIKLAFSRYGQTLASHLEQSNPAIQGPFQLARRRRTSSRTRRPDLTLFPRFKPSVRAV